MRIPDHLASRSVNLAFNTAQALAVPGLALQWPRSIIGDLPPPAPPLPAGFVTEFAAWRPFSSSEGRRSLLSALVSVPFFGRRLRNEPSGPLEFPGDYAGAHPKERWFFINGICTDRRLAMLNAAMLATIFRRPLTILYNETNGVLFDLAECAAGKGLDAVTEAAARNLHAFVAAVCDRAVERVVVVSHSQGTIIAAVLLKTLEELLAHEPAVRKGAGAQPPSPERKVARRLAGREGQAAQPAPARAAAEHARGLRAADLGKLELYNFANCATSMAPIVALGEPPEHAPWLESYGNEHDIVARLGVLAPPHGLGSARIEGDRYRRTGAWGHLFNAHYLAPFLTDLAGKTAPGSELTPFQDNLLQRPRLFAYADGRVPPPYVRR